MATFEAQHRRAKVLEARLESRVQQYSTIAQQINANFLHDEENPLVAEDNSEKNLSNEIECDLNEMYECINSMKNISQSRSHRSNHEDVLIRRYHEIHYDYSLEYKNTSATVNRKRESHELLESSKKLHMDDQDSSTTMLLRERSSIAASMASINDVIAQAFDTKNSLLGQRSSLSGSSTGTSKYFTYVYIYVSLYHEYCHKHPIRPPYQQYTLITVNLPAGISSVMSGVPSFNRMIEGVQVGALSLEGRILLLSYPIIADS